MHIFHNNLEFLNGFGSLIIVILCYITFIGNINRLIKANTFLIPILIISILVLSIQSRFELPTKSIQSYKYSNLLPSIGGAILYASYNSIILIPILLSLQKKLKSKKQIKYVAILCTIFLILLAICILNLIWKIDIDIRKIRASYYICCKSNGENLSIYIWIYYISINIYISHISRIWYFRK